MNKMGPLTISLLIIVFLTITIGGYWINVNNKEISLRNLSSKKNSEIEIFHDRMWKIISQKANVTKEYKDSFKDIYIGIMEGRYTNNSKDGSLMKWIQEDNPQFDNNMYVDLMNSIEIERTAFQKVQSQMLDIIREHNDLRLKIPSKFFISNDSEIIFTTITSTKSKNTMETKVDDNVEVF